MLHVQSIASSLRALTKSAASTLITRRVRIKRALEHRNGIDCTPNKAGGPNSRWGQRAAACPFRAVVAPHHTAHRFPMQRLGKGWPGGHV